MGRKLKFRGESKQNYKRPNHHEHNLHEAKQNKRDIVKNEVLQYLQKAGSCKPWAKHEECQSKSKEHNSNPFRKDTGKCKWESFSSDDTPDDKKKQTSVKHEEHQSKSKQRNSNSFSQGKGKRKFSNGTSEKPPTFEDLSNSRRHGLKRVITCLSTRSRDFPRNLEQAIDYINESKKEAESKKEVENESEICPE